MKEEFPKSNLIREQKLTEEEILNSNNITLIVKYAKENRSKVAIDKVRELLELARRSGEKIVQSFIDSFKECENKKIDYLDFENTENGQKALIFLEDMPEPFKTTAKNKLEEYKTQLKYNTELFKKHKNDSEKIWKEITDFEYKTDSDFAERFKAFLFKDSKGLSKSYWENNKLKVNNNPFAVEFWIRDSDSYEKLYSDIPNNKTSKTTAGFFTSKFKTDIIAIKDSSAFDFNSLQKGTSKHETEHAIHKKTNVIFTEKPKASRLGTRLYKNTKFESNKSMINGSIREGFYSNLDRAKDEIFAYFKGGTFKSVLISVLSGNSVSNHYDYNKDNRNESNEIINSNKLLSNEEKQQLQESINFLQSEYDRVLKNMIDVVYSQNESVEYLRNLPINEWYKASDGKYNRTDFTIKEFKF